MTKSHVGNELAIPESRQMINILEHVGKTLQPLELAEIVTRLPTLEAVEEQLKHAKEKNLSPSYICTLKRLKAYQEKEQEVISEAR